MSLRLQPPLPLSSPSLESLVATLPSDLCSTCADVDWAKVFDNKTRSAAMSPTTLQRLHRIDWDERHSSGLIILVTTMERLLASKCPMCKLFVSIIPKDVAISRPIENESWYIRAYCAAFALGFLRYRYPRGPLDPYEFPVLCVSRSKTPSSELETNIESGSLAILDPLSKFGVRHVSSNSLNINFVVESIKYCREHHGWLCSSENEQPVKLLKVIDCETRYIIAASDPCEYVALSYVWGNIAAESLTTVSDRTGQTHLCLPNSPRVIEDAIKVTLQLGYRYLWVDRYCIPQDHSKENHNQVKQMDLIYTNAMVTIIAAAGEDPHYGLPGVSIPHKAPQYIKIGSQIIGSTFPHPKFTITHSKWSSRGWTYQEGILSKRRLIFTDEQILFECNSMHCRERIALPLDEMHSESSKVFEQTIPSGAFELKYPHQNPKFMEFVTEFSKRNLGRLEDKLDAMQGIFSRFSSGWERVAEPKTVLQLMGIPIASAFPHAALRSAEVQFLNESCWISTTPGTRNPHFPSWTWAGWTSILGPIVTYEHSVLSPYCEVWIENGSEGNEPPTRFPEFSLLSDFLLKQPSFGKVFLQLKTKASLCCSIHEIECERFATFNSDDNTVATMPYSYYARLEDQEKTCFAFFADNKKDHSSCSAGALQSSRKSYWLIPLVYNYHWNELKGIVVREMDGYFERIGFVSSCYTWPPEREQQQSLWGISPMDLFEGAMAFDERRQSSCGISPANVATRTFRVG